MDFEERSLEEIDREIQELEERQRREEQEQAEEENSRRDAFRRWKENRERNELHRRLNPEFFQQQPRQFEAYASAPGWSYHHLPVQQTTTFEEEGEEEESSPDERRDGEEETIASNFQLHSSAAPETAHQHHHDASSPPTTTTRARGSSVDQQQHHHHHQESAPRTPSRSRGESAGSVPHRLSNATPTGTGAHTPAPEESSHTNSTPASTFLERVGLTSRAPHHRRTGSTSSQTSQTAATQGGGGRHRSGSTTALEEVKEMAKKKGLDEGDAGSRAGAADVLAAMKLSAKFTAAILGEALFVMARDWLDTTQSRPKPKSAEEEALEHSLTAETLAALEKEEAGGGGAERTRLRAAKSVKQMIDSSNVDEMVKGLRNARKLKEAEALSRRVVAIRREMYGERHLATSQALNQYASVLIKHKKFDEALVAYGEALKGVRDALGNQKAKAKREVMILHNMAVTWVMRARERNDEDSLGKAKKYGRMAYELSKTVNGALSPLTLRFERIWGVEVVRT